MKYWVGLLIWMLGSGAWASGLTEREYTVHFVQVLEEMSENEDKMARKLFSDCRILVRKARVKGYKSGIEILTDRCLVKSRARRTQYVAYNRKGNVTYYRSLQKGEKITLSVYDNLDAIQVTDVSSGQQFYEMDELTLMPLYREVNRVPRRVTLPVR